MRRVGKKSFDSARKMLCVMLMFMSLYSSGIDREKDNEEEEEERHMRWTFHTYGIYVYVYYILFSNFRVQTNQTKMV